MDSKITNIQGNEIKADKITKPIQLLAAWLSGLVLTNSTFLASAILIGPTIWTHYALITASIINVPLFLASIFILQTKFRPELQEDSYYSNYILNNRGDLIKQKETYIQIIKNQETIKTTGFNLFKYTIAINDYIENYKEIENELNNATIPTGHYFGKFNNVKEPPKRWLISINQEMEKDSIIAFLESIIKFKDQFDGFYFDKRLEFEDTDIYIGGYKDDVSFLPLNNMILDKIKSLEMSQIIK
jgi:hypothetical protein